MRHGSAVTLSQRLFETLLTFAKNPGRVLSKEELMTAVWPGRTLEEANLKQAISGLRKTLAEAGDDTEYIVTVPGRGYCFAVRVELRTPSTESDLAHFEAQTATAIPAVADEPPAEGGYYPRLALSNRWARFFGALGWRRATLLLLAGLLAVAAAYYALQRESATTGRATNSAEAPFNPPPRSVAVLAFTNLSGDPAQEYFSDGLANELINTLSQINALQVAARTSAFSFKGSHATIGEIARKLNVAAVLEGAVHRDSQHIHVTVQLIRASTGFAIWSETYDRDLSGIMALQSEIARAVADSLQARILDDEAVRISEGGTHDPRALDAYLRGVRLFYDGDMRGQTALGAFGEAIGLDPNYALAHVRRSQALRDALRESNDPSPGWKMRYEDEAVTEAQRAIALAPDLAIAYVALGLALEESRFDFKGALAAIEHAHALAPGDATTNMAEAYLQIHLGHSTEAIERAQAVVRSDPLSPVRYQTLAYIQTFARRYDDALVSIGQSIELEGRATLNDLDRICWIEYEKGDPDASLKTATPAQSWGQVFCQALALHKLGRTAEAMAALKRLQGMLGGHGAWQYTEVYAQWGRTQDALNWLQTAYRVGDPGLIELKVSQDVDPLRNTAALNDILRRLNFPP